MEVGSLYTQFSHSLLGYIRSKIRSKEDAEDILQNIFTRISLNVNTLAEKEKIQNWLFTVTRKSRQQRQTTRAEIDCLIKGQRGEGLRRRE